MLILLPGCFFVLLFLHFLGGEIPLRRGDETWYEALLLAAVLLGVLITFSIEVLSLLDTISKGWVTVIWGILLIGITVMSIWRRTLVSSWEKLRKSLRSIDKHGMWLYGGLAIIVLLLLAVALSTPPNNPDSHRYHMSRVTHWAQNQSLDHYPTSRIAQLIRPYWGEITILTLRVLWGSDHPANLVQWFCMVVSLIAVAGIVGLMGGDRRARILSAVFAVSVPMGILQSTTTQNDYAATLWVVVLAYFVVLSKRREMTLFEWGCTGASLGLGMLSKGTFYAFAFPLLLWLFLPQLFQTRWIKVFVRGLLVALVAILLNLGLWTRNIQTYGGLFGAPGAGTQSLIITRLSAQQGDADLTGVDTEVGEDQVRAPESAESSGGTPLKDFLERGLALLQTILRRIAQMVVQNFVLPIQRFQGAFAEKLYSFPGIFNADYVEDFGTVIWNHEDTAGNPLHLCLILGTLISFSFLYKDKNRSMILAYSGTALFGYFMLTLIDYGPDIYGVRYQLAFFILMSAGLGIFFRRILRVPLQRILIVGLFLYALAHVFFNNTRPVVGVEPWVTRVGSVFVEEDIDLLFAMSQGIQDEYIEIKDRVDEAGCRNLGLSFSKRDYEYLFWWLFDAPQSGVEIRHIRTRPELERYLDPSYQPCAVLCTVCEDEEDILGLPLDSDLGHIQLFMTPPS